MKLIKLYTEWSGAEPVSTENPLHVVSNRQYYRFTAEDGTTVVGVVGTSRDENYAFIYLAEHFEQRQLPVPHILAQSDDGLRYLPTSALRRSSTQYVAVARQAADTTSARSSC